MTDRTVYAAGDTICYRAFLTDAATNTPVSRSRYVYVELHDAIGDSLLERQMVKCDTDGVFAGTIPLRESLRSGYCQIVAYTQWMRNFGPDAFSYTQVGIVGNQEPPQIAAGADSETVLIPSQIRVAQRKNRLLIEASADIPGDSLVCVVYGNGNLLQSPINPGKVLQIDTQALHPGLATIAIFDTQRQEVLSERVWNNEGGPEADIGIALERGDTCDYLTITVSKDCGVDIEGYYALSVTDCEYAVADSALPNLKHSLLVEAERRNRYPLSDIVAGKYPQIAYNFQTAQYIRGRVRGTLIKKVKTPRLIMLEPATGKMQSFELGDSSRFSLGVDCPENTTYLLEAVGLNNRTSLIQLDIDKETFPKVSLPRLRPIRQLTDTTFLHSMRPVAPADDGTVWIPEVLKSGHRAKPVNPRMGYPSFSILEGDPRLSIVKNISTLLDVLGAGPGTTVQVTGGGKGFVRVSDIPPSEIQQMDLYRMFKVPGKFKMPTYKVFIRLKKGARPRIYKKPNMVAIKPQGYKWSETAAKTPGRAMIYWNPKVRIGAADIPKIPLPKLDSQRKYVIQLQGVSRNGVIISKRNLTGLKHRYEL